MAIQGRVIHALLMREIIVRFGRGNIGFLWMFLGPMLLIGVITGFQEIMSVENSSNTVPLVPFIVTGWSAMMLWRSTSSMCMNAITLNTPLLYFRNVTTYDLLFAWMIFEGAAMTVSFVLLVIIFVAFGWISFPNDLLIIMTGWFLLFIFGCGLGMILAVIGDIFEPFKRIWGVASFALMLISGTFFMVDWLPTEAQEIVLWIPMVHGNEMIREGFFEYQVTAHYSLFYMISVDLLLLFVGLYLVQKKRHLLGTR